MSGYSFTPLARQDLLEIYDYIAVDNLEAAGKLLDRFTQIFKRLAAMPFSGRRRSELGENIHCVPEGNYIIFYRPSSVGIQILRVLHGARNIEQIFSEDE